MGIPLGTLPWQHKQNLFVVLPFQNELEYRNANGQIHNALNVATLCTKLVMFGAVTPEKRLLYIFCTFVKKKIQKWAYSADYLRTCSTDLDHIVMFGTHVCWNDKTDVRSEIT